ncbi:hypothetical protein [Lutispora sp.]|uniref:hypothetical protein n=1 Tax=Lutispora sp. TaxID=2828727 RepID=UPI002B208365|nr:hypothetical protein [Lutispora sp.]MEA4963367.1 hypothetical protein [Lutispora sp.]
MKKIAAIMIILAMVFTCGFSDTAPSGLWAKYTAADGSFSFHYPKEWKAAADKSAVSIDNAKTDEQLMMAMIPYDKDKNPAAMANDFITLLKESNPNIQASNWQTDPKTGSSQVIFDLTDKIDQKQYNGLGIVIKDSQQAIWFSYTAPAAGYSRDRGIALLQGLIGSLAYGSGSKDPEIIYDLDLTAKIDANAKGFIFVLEFALGAPLTGSQEQAILDELKSGWRSLTEKELTEYDQYPVLAKTILVMGQKDLEELRSELEKTVIEWIDGSPDSDEAVKIIRDQLKIRGKEVIAGDPPLTEMALTAYSEIIAYSRLLRQNPKAMPEQISPDSVKEIKKQVEGVWKTFTDKEREQIATCPGLWICLRTLLAGGSKSEQDKVRSDIVNLTPETQAIKGNEKSGAGEKPMTMAAHNSLMAIQQMTFNTYMWSRGFNYSPVFGKMW